MKPRVLLLLVAGLLLSRSSHARAQSLPNVGPMTVNSATAGSQPNQVTATSFYSSNLILFGQQRVVAYLNANVPANTTLSVKLTAPSGGTSLGNVNLDTTPRDLVIAATAPFFTNVTILYTFKATVLAGVVPSTSRTVTYTLATYP
ncbi:MAG: hypothetical protein ABI625_07490 [bacterium]